jgi:hypothetical protein
LPNVSTVLSSGKASTSDHSIRRLGAEQRANRFFDRSPRSPRGSADTSSFEKAAWPHRCAVLNAIA